MRKTGTWKYLLFGLLAAMLPAPAGATGSDTQACLDATFDHGLDPVVETCSRAIEAGTAEGSTLILLDLKRARAYYRAGRLDRALSDIQAALDLHADNPEALVLRANIYYRGGQYRMALRDVMQAISIEPTTFNAYLVLASALKFTGGSREDVVAALLQELTHHPDNWFARHELAVMYFDGFGRIDAGLAEINKVIAADPEVVGKQFIWHRDPYDHFDLYAYAMLTRANMYRRLRKFDLAKADYGWLIAHWPEESRFLSARATLFGMNQQYGKALADLDSALAVAPRNEYARIVRTGLLMSRNRDDDALKDINFLLARGSAYRSVVLSYRAEIRKKRGQRAAALEDLEQAFSQDKNLVQQFQQRLSKAGYYEGRPDGRYSEATRNGVKACLIDPRC